MMATLENNQHLLRSCQLGNLLWEFPSLDDVRIGKQMQTLLGLISSSILVRKCAEYLLCKMYGNFSYYYPHDNLKDITKNNHISFPDLDLGLICKQTDSKAPQPTCQV